jgi:type IV pilus assembly protein PilE
MKKQTGFTLVELLIVIAIISIIAAIAVPSYMDNVRQTKRTEAQAALVQLSQAMERYYTVNYSYEGAANGGSDTGAPAATTFPSTQSPATGTAAYNLTISAATASDYTLTATPAGAQTADPCGTLTLTSTNVRGDGGPAGMECWR